MLLLYFIQAASASGLVISTLLIFSIISRRRELLRTHLDRLTLALVICCWLQATAVFIHCLLFIYLFEYKVTFFLSQYDGIVCCLLLGSNNLIHSLISIERYFKIVKGTEPSMIVILPIVIIISLMTLSVTTIVSIQGFTVFESGLFSFLDFSSSKPLDLVGNWIGTVFIVINNVTIIFCYGSIYLKINAERRVISQYIPDVNFNIAKRFLIIIVAYLIAYAPSYLSFIYRLASRSRIAPEIEIFCTSLTILEPTITCSLLFYLNKNYRETLEKRSASKSDRSI